LRSSRSSRRISPAPRQTPTPTPTHQPKPNPNPNPPTHQPNPKPTQALYDCYLKLGATLKMEHRQLLAWEMISQMSEHAAKEELVLYPAIRWVCACLCVWAGVKRFGWDVVLAGGLVVEC